MPTDLDHRVRIATFAWLEEQVRLHGDVLSWRVIKQGVPFRDERIPLISQQGIFKPRILPEIPLWMMPRGSIDSRSAAWTLPNRVHPAVVGHLRSISAINAGGVR